MKMSKENMSSKLNTWLKHVNANDSKFFFECNAYTGLKKEDFINELKWLFNDPQDAETQRHNPYRREVFFYPDGTAHRFIRIYEEADVNDWGCGRRADTVKRVALENFENRNMEFFNPCSIQGHNVGLCIWDPIEVLKDNESTDIIKKAETWRKNAKKWGIIK